MINRVFCFVREENGVKYLSIDKEVENLSDSILTMWNQVFSGIEYHIKKISPECKSSSECKGFPECEKFPKHKVNYEGDFAQIKSVSNDLLPLGKLIYFLTLTVVIRLQ